MNRVLAKLFVVLATLMMPAVIYAEPPTLELPAAKHEQLWGKGISGNYLEPKVYFSDAELRAAFLYQYRHEPRMPNPIRAIEKGYPPQYSYITAVEGETFDVPARFVNNVRRHIFEMIRAGAARYIFLGDLGHAHFVLPKDRFDYCIRFATERERLHCYLNEKELGALYHSAEFLEYNDNDTPEVKAWRSKRNVLGWFDDRPIEVLPADDRGRGGALPGKLRSFHGFNFAARSIGELPLFDMRVTADFADTMMFQITFDEP